MEIGEIATEDNFQKKKGNYQKKLEVTINVRIFKGKEKR